MPDASVAARYRYSVSAEFVLPKKEKKPTTRVAAVSPSGDLLPENILKLYVELSAPMGRGGAYHHIHLRDDATGKDLELPFLEIAEELWDPQGKRLTLLFDPGRIKTGLKPRAELGSIVQQGKTYTLIIDPAWLDAESRPLVDGFRKTYKVGPADEVSPNPTAWRIQVPEPSTRDPLILNFPEPLDRALLGRLIQVMDGEGRPVAGTIDIDRSETRWRLFPELPWKSGGYCISANKDLEDLAGNSIGRPFEVDVFDKVENSPHAETIAIPFRVGLKL